MNDKTTNNQLKNFIKGFAGIFIYLFLNLATAPILSSLGIDPRELSRKTAVLISITISLIVLAILILISFKKLKENFKDFKKNWKELLKRNVKYWLCALLVMFVCNLAISIIFNRVTSANDQGIREQFNVFPIFIMIETILLAPATEELVFRQSIRYMAENKYVFIITSGLIFGFMHILASLQSIDDILYIIPYSVPGFFFAYMLYKEDNVLVPISFHMIHNSMAIILLIIAKIVGI